MTIRWAKGWLTLGPKMKSICPQGTSRAAPSHSHLYLVWFETVPQAEASHGVCFPLGLSFPS